MKRIKANCNASLSPPSLFIVLVLFLWSFSCCCVLFSECRQIDLNLMVNFEEKSQETMKEMNSKRKYTEEILRISKSSSIFNNLKTSVNPCDNFYEFACGNWMRMNRANGGNRKSTGTFVTIDEALTRKIHEILNEEEEEEEEYDEEEERRKRDNDGVVVVGVKQTVDNEEQVLMEGEKVDVEKNVKNEDDSIDYDKEVDKKVKDFYNSCVQLKHHSKHTYRRKLLNLIAEFGKMPALMEKNNHKRRNNGSVWNEHYFDWLDTIARIQYKYGIVIIIGVDVAPDYRNHSRNMIYIAHPEFELETRSMYVNRSNVIYREYYKLHITSQLMEYLGMSNKLAIRTAQEIVDFEVSIAKYMLDDMSPNKMDEINNLTTSRELQHKYGTHLNIKHLMEIVISKNWNHSEPIFEMVPEYHLNLMNVMKRTSKRIVANYIYYILIKSFIFDTSESIDTQRMTCIDSVKKYFPRLISNMVYRRLNNISRVLETNIQDMWIEIRDTMKRLFQSKRIVWMNSTETLQFNINKLDTIKFEIASYDSRQLVKDYAELNVDDRRYFVNNMKKYYIWSAKCKRAQLSEIPQPLDIGEHLLFTAVNILMENRILIPVTYLMPFYFWAPVYPMALKYSTIGFLISHELMHAFDETGRTFNGQGDYGKWWDNSSVHNFKERVECFIKQYQQYKYNGHNLPAMTDQSENIADNGGLHLAYEAYKNWYNNAVRHGTSKRSQSLKWETMHPKLNYTNEQLFFISYAQLWCSDTHSSIKNLQVSTDTHVPEMFRVRGPLSNFAPFARSFNCPRDTYMNPAEKCILY